MLKHLKACLKIEEIKVKEDLLVIMTSLREPHRIMLRIFPIGKNSMLLQFLVPSAMDAMATTIWKQTVPPTIFFKEKGKDMAAARQSVVVSSIECAHDVY